MTVYIHPSQFRIEEHSTAGIGYYPVILLTDGETTPALILRSWSQLEQLGAAITKALDTFYASELKDVEVFQ